MTLYTADLSSSAIAVIAKTKAEDWFMTTATPEILDYVVNKNLRDDTASNFYKAIIDAKAADFIALANETGQM